LLIAVTKFGGVWQFPIREPAAGWVVRGLIPPVGDIPWVWPPDGARRNKAGHAQTEAWLQRVVRGVLRKWGRLRLRFFFKAEYRDLDDPLQTAWQTFLEVLPRWDPDAGTLGAFAGTGVRRQCWRLLRWQSSDETLPPNLDDYRQHEEDGTWLGTVSLDSMASTKPDETRTWHETVAAPDPDPEAEWPARAEALARRVLHTQSYEYRIVWRVLRGMTQEEIAKELDLSEGEVSRAKDRAAEILAAAVADELDQSWRTAAERREAPAQAFRQQQTENTIDRSVLSLLFIDERPSEKPRKRILKTGLQSIWRTAAINGAGGINGVEHIKTKGGWEPLLPPMQPIDRPWVRPIGRSLADGGPTWDGRWWHWPNFPHLLFRDDR
jgi:RNA polymerase sigma factor (sigma-70 family)